MTIQSKEELQEIPKPPQDITNDTDSYEIILVEENINNVVTPLIIQTKRVK